MQRFAWGEMKRLCPFAVLPLIFLSLSRPLSSAKMAANSPAFTAEQMEIYVLFFNTFLSEQKVPVVLAGKTDPLKLSPDELKGCVSGIELPNMQRTKLASHPLGAGFISQIKSRLFDSSRLRTTSSLNSPHQQRPGKQTSDEVKFGWLQVSEVVFDRNHRYAMMRFYFSCGALCGRSRLLVFTHDGDHWKEKIDTSCPDWVS